MLSSYFPNKLKYVILIHGGVKWILIFSFLFRCSFHVGSGCRDAAAYSQAISSAREVMNTGVKIGFDMRVLDIGGGFPGQESVQLKFKEVCQ